MNRLKPVPVTGIGCICAAGGTLSGCMDTLFTRAPAPAPPVSCPGSQHPVFAVPDRFLPEDTPLPLTGTRAARLALKAAQEALADAGLNPEMLCGKKVGVMIGTNVSGGVSNRSLLRHGAGEAPGNMRPCPSPAERFLAVNPAWWIARHFDFSGPCQTIVNACSAGSDAIGLAGAWIRSGRCDMVIAGGVDAFYEVTYFGFIALMNCDTAPCKPFDARRNGLNLGEGAGILVLARNANPANGGFGPFPAARIDGISITGAAWSCRRRLRSRLIAASFSHPPRSDVPPE